jgi:DNA polymerase-1
MLIAVAPLLGGAARVCELTDGGQPAGPVREVADLVACAREHGAGARWLWPSTSEVYPPLLRAGARIDRCHDVELTEALLLGYSGRWGQPKSLGAAWARKHGLPVPPDPVPAAPIPPGEAQAALFEAAAPAPVVELGTDPLAALVEVYRDQLERIAATERPGRFRLLVAAESAGALVAAEMGQVGLPWRADVHDEILRDLLGSASRVGGPPARLVELTERIAAALGGQRIHPESPAEVVRALAREGISVPNTRAWVLRQVDHPAVPLLLEYKELYRIWVAHGWAWRAQWVREGRFHAEYVPGGVVSGRWATRGGGALQIPRAVRRAVCAEPGWKLVVADAGQLEPRILAAVSGDPGMSRAAGAGDMYAVLATEAFGGDRGRAKVALLGAMYGQTGGAAAPALAALRRSYPRALSFVEDAARTGEGGGLVRSWLGRTCPPGGAGSDDPEEVRHTGASERARGRFTRNFVIQATAAEWAVAMLALLRRGLGDLPAELVFFQHDEVIVHCPAEVAAQVAMLVEQAADEARRLLFGSTPVRLPIAAHIVDSYADAK